MSQKPVESAFPAVEFELETAVPRIFDVRRAVHVPHQVHQAADRHTDRRIVLTAVAAEFLHRILDAQHGVALGRTGHWITAFGVGIESVPFRSGTVRLRSAHGVHPRGIVDDRTAVEVLPDVFLRPGRQVAFRNVGDGIVSGLAPAESRAANAEKHGGEQEKVFLHLGSVFVRQI